MLKTLLKSSVSGLVFLSAITIINPSQAMNAEEDENIKKILTPFKGRPNTHLVLPEPLDNISSQLHKELWLNIFESLGYDQICTAEFVCKSWRLMILGEGRNLHCIIHPANIFWMHEQMEPWINPYLIATHPEYFSNPFFSKETLDPYGRAVIQNSENSFSKIGAHLNNDPNFRSFLTRKYLHLNPNKDCVEVCLASHMVKESREMQDSLQKVLNIHAIEIDQFPELIQNPENYQRLHQFLMALKLLTLSGDKNACDKMFQYTQLFNYGDINIIDYFLEKQAPESESFYKRKPFTEEQSIVQKQYIKNYFDWAAYTDDVGAVDSQLAKAGHLLFHINEAIIDLKVIKKIEKYCTIRLFFPAILGNYSSEYFKLLIIFYEQQDDSPKILETLDTYHSVIKKEDVYPYIKLEDVLSLASNYVDEGQYAKAILILEEVYQHHEQSLKGLCVAHNMAKYILASQDETRFPQVKKFIQLINEKYSEDPEFPQIWADEGQNNLVFLTAPLDIYEGDFKNAYQSLKDYFDSIIYEGFLEGDGHPDEDLVERFDTDSENSESPDLSNKDVTEQPAFIDVFLSDLNNGLIQAFQAQIHNPDLPKELVTLMSKMVTSCFANCWNDEGMWVHQRAFKKFIFKHYETLTFLLQDSLEGEKHFKVRLR